jgi:predicted transposase YbfD/YdcC
MSAQFQKGNFIIVPNKHKLNKLSMKAQVTWLALCAHADEDGYCWPSIPTLSKLSGVGERTIKRGIEELVAVKFVTKKQRKKEDGSFHSNYYTLFEHLKKGG